jgi:formylglycine-generating enzyme required for sulfatase activity
MKSGSSVMAHLGLLALIGVGSVAALSPALAQREARAARVPPEEQRSFIGIGIAPVPGGGAPGVGAGEGVLIQTVDPNAPAARAGIRVGDIILSVGGTAVSQANFVQTVVALPTSPVPVVLVRNGERQTVSVTPVRGTPSELAARFSVQASGTIYPMGRFVPLRVAGTRHCFLIDTEPGQSMTVRLRQAGNYGRDRGNGLTAQNNVVEIGFSETCDDSSIEWHNVHSETRLINITNFAVVPYQPMSDVGFDFVAGGGRYAVRISPGVDSYNPHETLLYVGLASRTVVAPRLPSVRSRALSAENSVGTASTSTAANTVPRPAGIRFRDCENVCPEMVVLPAGSFMMGSISAEEGRDADEGPVRQVTFARPFAMGRYEVTWDEYAACVADGGCARPQPTGWGEGRRPVSNVSWFDARGYADWLSRRTGERYFLPSEAEWEYAARAGTTTPWNTGEAIITDDANILNQFRQAVPVGGFPPNAFGLYDMHGNVGERTLDCYDVGYFGTPIDGSANVTPNCQRRVIRGGGYAAEPRHVRSAYRNALPPDYVGAGTGFRVARAL